MLPAPAAGTNTVRVSYSGCTSDVEAGSISFTGVNQSTPLAHVTTNFGSGTNPGVTVTSASGDMVVDVVGQRQCDQQFKSDFALAQEPEWQYGSRQRCAIDGGGSLIRHHGLFHHKQRLVGNHRRRCGCGAVNYHRLTNTYCLRDRGTQGDG